MTEAEVQAALVAVLRERGWDVTTENADYRDVITRHGSDCIVAEVEGETSSAGTDVDTAYGQLLRRCAFSTSTTLASSIPTGTSFVGEIRR